MPRLPGILALAFWICFFSSGPGSLRASVPAPRDVFWNGKPVALFPATHEQDPGLPSPYRAPDGTVTLTARLADGRAAVVSVTLRPEQRTTDAEDFPALSVSGRHDEKTLAATRTITGRSVAEITTLGRPGGLSASGFMADDEDVLSVLIADNRRVERLGLTHRALAEPLSHVMNLLDTDIGVVWANHSFDGLAAFSYNGREIRIRGIGTKGGQESIFADGIGGALDLDIWRDLDARELAFLRNAYPALPEDGFHALVRALSRIHTGEMEPQYIVRYGFYEGHTEYRTDPLAIALIFGLRTVEEIEAAFPGKLPETLADHFTPARVVPILEPRAPARGETRPRIVLLGTAGGPTPKRTRSAPAQALEIGGAVYLVDCGNGVARQMALAGLPFRDLRHVFVTHHHSDHVADLFTLPLLAWAAGLEEPLTLHGPPPLRKAVKAGFRQLAFDIETREADEGRRPLRDVIRVREFEGDGVVHRDERVTVRAVRVVHPPIGETYAYRFDAEGLSVVVSADTAPSESLVRLAKGADVLVHEVLLVDPPELSHLLGKPPDHLLTRHVVRSHTSFRDVGKVAAAAGVRKLVLSHFVPGDFSFDREAILAEIRRSFAGEVVFGEDLLEVR